MKKVFKLVLCAVTVMALFSACGKKNSVDPELLKPFLGEWQCDENPVEYEDFYTGFLVLKIEEDASFRMYDAEAGNPGISGDLDILSDTELVLKCNTDDDFDPPPTWENMSEEQTVKYEFVSEYELHIVFEDDGNVSTLVFRMEGAEANVDTFAFMEDKIAVGDTDNLFYVPNETVNGMSNAELYLVGNSLLVTEQVMDEDRSDLVLKMISLEDGSLLAEHCFVASGDAMIQMGDGYIALQDPAMGQIHLMDHELNIVNAYEFEPIYDKWYLDPEMGRLYLFAYDGIVAVRDLATEEETELLANVTEVQVLGYQNHTVIFSYVNEGSEEPEYKALELSMGTLENVPFEGEIGNASRYSNIWLVQDVDGQYTVRTNETVGSVPCENGTLRLLGSKQYLLNLDEKQCALKLYDLQGKHVTAGSLEEDQEHLLSQNFVWSGYWQGYFFADTREQGARLMFWDPAVPVEGEDLDVDLEEVVEVPVATMEELRVKADGISEKYGFDIRIGDACALDYVGHYAELCEDVNMIWDALNTFDACLAKYPEGFMEQLLFGAIETIYVDFVGELSLKEGVDSVGSTAFVQEKEDYIVIVFNAILMPDEIVYHELSHVIDKRLEWDMYTQDNVMFSNEEWLKLQPEGFDYAYSYTNIPESVKAYYESGYFVEEYACTFPTEDRATLMEAAMGGLDHFFVDRPGIRNKMKYYSDCIRDTFDTTGWPEVTLWERYNDL